MTGVPSPGLAILALGPPATPDPIGWGFSFPGPIVAITGNDGLRRYTSRHRFLHIPARTIRDATDVLTSAMESAESHSIRTVLVQGLDPWWSPGERGASVQERRRFADALSALRNRGVHLWLTSSCSEDSAQLPAAHAFITDLGPSMDVVVEIDRRRRLSFHRFFEGPAPEPSMDLFCESFPHLAVAVLRTDRARGQHLSERAWAGLLNAQDRDVREQAMTLMGDFRG